MEHAVAASAFCGIQRLISGGHQRGFIRHGRKQRRCADADRHAPLRPRGPGDSGAKPLRQGHCAAGVGQRQHGKELFAAVAGEKVSVPALAAQDGRQPAQDFVARRMPEAVVVSLERVHVQQQQGQRRAVTLCLVHFLDHTLLKGPPVAEAGQAVVESQRFKLPVGFLKLVFLLFQHGGILGNLDHLPGDLVGGAPPLGDVGECRHDRIRLVRIGPEQRFGVDRDPKHLALNFARFALARQAHDHVLLRNAPAQGCHQRVGTLRELCAVLAHRRKLRVHRAQAVHLGAGHF